MGFSNMKIYKYSDFYFYDDFLIGERRKGSFLVPIGIQSDKTEFKIKFESLSS